SPPRALRCSWTGLAAELSAAAGRALTMSAATVKTLDSATLRMLASHSGKTSPRVVRGFLPRPFSLIPRPGNVQPCPTAAATRTSGRQQFSHGPEQAGHGYPVVVSIRVAVMGVPPVDGMIIVIQLAVTLRLNSEDSAAVWNDAGVVAVAVTGAPLPSCPGRSA